jgi:LicD family
MKIRPSGKPPSELWQAAYLWLRACGNKISSKYCREAIMNHPYYPAQTSLLDFIESGGMRYQALCADISNINKFNYPLLAQIKHQDQDFWLMIRDMAAWEKQKEIGEHWTGNIIYPEKNARWQIEQRRASIKETILNYNVWTPSQKKMVRKILRILSHLSRELDIDLILDSGSLLGHIRHGQIIAWDDDVDLAIEKSHFERLLSSIQKTPLLEHSSCLWSTSNCVYHKFWLADGEPIDNHEYLFPFVDIWIFTMKDGQLVFNDGRVFQKKHFYPLKEVEFEYSKFKIPQHAVKCLNAQYPGWKKEIQIYCWSHRMEKWHNYPLSIKIKITENGKLDIL